MLKKFENWLLENNYKPNTAKDYKYRIQRICKKDDISLDMLVENINNLQPSELFGFTPNHFSDTYGTSVTQPLTWIRPQTLATCNITDYDQIIGHTPAKKIVNMKECTKQNRNILLCDTLGHREYLIIEDNEFIPKILPK